MKRLTEHSEEQKQKALDVAYCLLERKEALDAYIATSTHFKEDVNPVFVENLDAANKKRDRALQVFLLSLLA